MRRFLTISLFAAVPIIIACDAAGPGNEGPLALGIVAGQNQVGVAGAERLPDPVVGKLVREPGGGITFRLVTPAYAQGTVVNGSPVPGAVVCAVSVTEGGMEPFTPCTNTGQDGTATFFFSPGTHAGEAMSEIRGTVEGEPAVFDTAVAIIEPGEAYDPSIGGGIRNIPVGGSTAFSPNHFTDEYGNTIEYSLAASGSAVEVVQGLSLAMKAGAVVGDTARLVFTRTSDSSVLVDARATITAIDATEWDLEFLVH